MQTVKVDLQADDVGYPTPLDRLCEQSYISSTFSFYDLKEQFSKNTTLNVLQIIFDIF